MCGRFTITRPAREVQELFNLTELPEFLQPRYNAAPSQMIPVVGLKPNSEERGCVPMRWGFVPRWNKDEKGGFKPINAMRETVATNGVFRASFKDRRCLIPMDGFFEWQKVGKEKQPYLFRPAALAAFAGVWDAWKAPGSGEPVFTFAVITTTPNSIVEPVHNRMPVILDPACFAAWLDPNTPAAGALELLKPYPADKMTAVPVNRALNNARHDAPDCIEPV
ncbi:SOS response-associated peptidase [Fimbriiglobus ruber]|uniref:Abasic site processing protein n=1 Tax=Fimbriiglobus ruber TaxID=1908690 RepID=A0A225D203_9BACT|nr:SOS response-associated peptidase [Fimbriiglobus ruber]OWK35552.1 hypothetical protein FRUB_08115 [Fimbriiglobus ruber]